MATKSGYNGRWVYVDLTTGAVTSRDSDPRVERDFIGGRGLQAWLLAERVRELGGPVHDPLGPDNRIVIGCSAPNDTRIHTAGRGSASFFSPFTSSPRPLSRDLPPVWGLITHSSVGGSMPNKLKKAGIDQIVIDGRATTPVRIEVVDGAVRLLEAEPELFEDRDGCRFPLRARAMDAVLKRLVNDNRAASVYLGPAGWMRVPYACLTSDCDRNFGRGGAGAVFGSKNLVAISFAGSTPTTLHDRGLFDRCMDTLDASIETSVSDPAKTASFRPTTGTTWWLDRAFRGGYLGNEGGYLPWHNYDEGHFDEKLFSQVGTDALLEISAKYKICTRCREVLCARMVRTDEGELMPRPEFETAALFINCCITDRTALVDLNHLCNEVGLDTMSTAAVIAAAMDLDERGVLADLGLSLPFGDGDAMARAVEDIAYRRGLLGDLLGDSSDASAHRILERLGEHRRKDLVWSFTTGYGGLGYAGIEPKAFPAMYTCYATSNRGRGDHTYAWTVQAEEGGLVTTAGDIAALVASGQWGKALVDSLGLCDFFPYDTGLENFRDLLYAVTGNRYSAEELTTCGRRIVNLERLLNSIQGRVRAYDAYIPQKLTVPMSEGPLKGRRVDPELVGSILDAFYREQGWSNEGLVTDATLASLGLEHPLA